MDSDFALSTLSRIFDQNRDGRINEEEFIEGSKKLIQEAKDDSTSKKFLDEANFLLLLLSVTNIDSRGWFCNQKDHLYLAKLEEC